MTRVIGARELEEMATGATLNVPADAIITPLAMDIIREKRLKIDTCEADAKKTTRSRIDEIEAAEGVLTEMEGPSALVRNAGWGISESGSSFVQGSHADQIAREVTDLQRERSSPAATAVDVGDTLKFATFGIDSTAVLRAVFNETERLGVVIERMSGRTTLGVFILAVIVSCEDSTELKRHLEGRLSSCSLPVVFE
ncbi:MAG: hypothetical protein JW941_01830 [Candidatus Coatesbacteria bacterium]|nr:hypothetical protein [Candidatus Coatesbacteria bacterium]